MGVFISRFIKKNKSTLEILEQIEQEINRLQKFKRMNQERQKWLMAKLLMYSILMYVVAAIVVYFYYFPETWKERILYTVPLLLFPVLTWFAKQTILWLFVKRIAKNDNALEILTSKKKQVLECVMEKETYKKAKEILEKYDPDRHKELEVQLPMQTPTNAHTLGMELRQRQGQMIQPQSFQQQPAVMPATIGMTPARPVQPVGSMYMGMTPYETRNPTQNVQPGVLLNSPNIDGETPLGPPLPRPVLPRDRGILDRLLEYLVGDGPQNRYALICQSCFSHNGMAMKEEFEYIAFRCCYCYTLNPAKKIRPLAPRIGCQRSAPVISTVSHQGLPFSQPSSPAKLICSAEPTGTELPTDMPQSISAELPTATEPTMGTVPPAEVPLANDGRSNDAGEDGVSIENVGAVIGKLALQEKEHVENNAPSAANEAAKETITKETKEAEKGSIKKSTMEEKTVKMG